VEEEKTPTNDTVVEFGDKKEFNLPLFLVWLGAIISIVFLGVFWFMNVSLKSQIEEKQSEKSELTVKLGSNEYKDVENKAESVRVAVETLDQISNNRIKTKDFLDELYKKVTNDVKISSISIGAEGTISLEGATGSYKQVADFMLGVKSYERLSNVELSSVSLSTDETAKNNEKVIFSVAGKVDLSKDNSTSE
jgi:Tfp pilus assembly protein PilN